MLINVRNFELDSYSALVKMCDNYDLDKIELPCSSYTITYLLYTVVIISYCSVLYVCFFGSGYLLPTDL